MPGNQPAKMLIDTPRSAEIYGTLEKLDADENTTDTDLRIAIVNFLFVKINETMSPDTLQQFKDNLGFLDSMAEASLGVQADLRAA